MAAQKQTVLELVAAHRGQGRTVAEVLGSVGVARSSYYRWKKSAAKPDGRRQSSYEITTEERKLIDEVKEEHPMYRHRKIQGVLQQRGVYLSASAIYEHLKATGRVEPYERRQAPWQSPHYEVWQKNLMWGSDWTKLRVAGIRWYLVTVIDFFSRWIVAWEVVPTVHAGVIKAIYETGLSNQGISKPSSMKPEFRVDRGSPNTSGVTQEFFEMLGAELSFARVRRPTDNALTERFYGTIKQEEIYVVGNYPDAISAKGGDRALHRALPSPTTASGTDEFHSGSCARTKQQESAVGRAQRDETKDSGETQRVLEPTVRDDGRVRFGG
jgi:transposase InsO family protein